MNPGIQSASPGQTTENDGQSVPSLQRPGCADRVYYFRIFMLVHIAVVTWLRHRGHTGDYLPPLTDAYLTMARFGLIALSLAALLPMLRRTAVPLTTLIVGGIAVMGLPLTANHIYLEFFSLVLLCFVGDGDEDECQLVVDVFRWMIAIVLFYTGLQKVIYGQYFDGAFLAFMTNSDARFATMFQYVMPSAEFQALREIDIRTVGSGPIRFHSWHMLLCSNCVYLAEMGLPLLLMIRRTRAFACFAMILFVIAIELGAREVMFGFLFVNLILLTCERNWVKWFLPVSVTFYLYLILANAGFLPNYHLRT